MHTRSEKKKEYDDDDDAFGWMMKEKIAKGSSKFLPFSSELERKNEAFVLVSLFGSILLSSNSFADIFSKIILLYAN